MCCLPFLDALMLVRVTEIESGEPSLDITASHGEALNHVIRLTGIRPGELARLIGITPARVSTLCNGAAGSLSFTPLKGLESLCADRGYQKLAEYWRRQSVAALDRVARQGGRK